MAEMSLLRRRITGGMTVRNLFAGDATGHQRSTRAAAPRPVHPRQRTVSRRNKNVEIGGSSGRHHSGNATTVGELAQRSEGRHLLIDRCFQDEPACRAGRRLGCATP
jgi:hypothetical protein